MCCKDKSWVVAAEAIWSTKPKTFIRYRGKSDTDMVPGPSSGSYQLEELLYVCWLILNVG
jgi:hypothetical protein